METSRLIATKGMSLVVLVLLSLSLMPSALAQAQTPEAACQESCSAASEIQCGSQGTMSCCGESPPTIPVDRTYELLTKPELHFAVARALANSDVQALKRAFMKMGYMPRFSDAAAVKTTVTNENGTFWYIATVLPFSEAFTERTPGPQNTPTLTSAAIIYFDLGQDDTFFDVSLSIGLVRYQLDENTWDVTLYGLDENRQPIVAAQQPVISASGSWLCLLICEVACLFGCGAGCGAICAAACGGPCAACVGAWWTCAACLACVLGCGGICNVLCTVIYIYGCEPGCGWLCEHI